jgi:hypothetical protein
MSTEETNKDEAEATMIGGRSVDRVVKPEGTDSISIAGYPGRESRTLRKVSIIGS